MPVAMRRALIVLPPPDGPISPTRSGTRSRTAGLASNLRSDCFMSSCCQNVRVKEFSFLPLQPPSHGESWVLGANQTGRITRPAVGLHAIQPDGPRGRELLASHGEPLLRKLDGGHRVGLAVLLHQEYMAPAPGALRVHDV